MDRLLMKIRGLWTSVGKRPLCTANGIVVFLIMIWLGIVLLLKHKTLTTIGFNGPKTFAPLWLWGWGFVGGGLAALLRVFLLTYEKIGLLLHMPTMAIALGWTISFYFGPLSTGQAIYTFFALYVVLQPFIPKLVLGAIKFGGYKIEDPRHPEIYTFSVIRVKMDELVLSHFKNKGV